MSILSRINHLLDRLSRWFAIVGGILILLMTILISYDIVRRYLFNDPLLGAQEIVAYMLLTAFFLFITECWNGALHVRMTIVYEKLAGKWKKAADAFVGFSGAILFGGLAWKIGEELVYAIESEQVSSELLMPVWPFKLIALICLTVFVSKLAVSTLIPPEGKSH